MTVVVLILSIILLFGIMYMAFTDVDESPWFRLAIGLWVGIRVVIFCLIIYVIAHFLIKYW